MAGPLHSEVSGKGIGSPVLKLFFSSPHALGFQMVLMIKAVPKTSFNFSSHWGKISFPFPCLQAYSNQGFFLPLLFRDAGKGWDHFSSKGTIAFSLHHREQPHPFLLQHYALVAESGTGKVPGVVVALKVGLGTLHPHPALPSVAQKEQGIRLKKCIPYFRPGEWDAHATVHLFSVLEWHHLGKGSHGEGSNTPQLTIHHCGENLMMGFAQYMLYFLHFRTIEHHDWPCWPQTQWKQCRFKTGHAGLLLITEMLCSAWPAPAQKAAHAVPKRVQSLAPAPMEAMENILVTTAGTAGCSGLT